MKEILIISDTHYPKFSVNSLLYDLIASGDLLIHCGDLEEEEFSETLEDTGKPILAVKGNNYDYLINFKLPSKILFQVEDKVIGTCHENGKYIEAIG